MGSGRVVDWGHTTNTIWADIDLSAPARVVFNQTFAPAWQSAHGGVVEDAGRLAMDVEAGRQRIELRYRPPEMSVSIGITLVGAMLTLLTAALARPERLMRFMPARWRQQTRCSARPTPAARSLAPHAWYCAREASKMRTGMTHRRALIIGAGGFSREWAKTLVAHPDVEVAGWVSRRQTSVDEAVASSGLGGIFTGTDLEAALARVRPDFVVDVTPAEAHHDVTLSALRAGVPVLGEKPMAASLAQARAMVAASEHSGKLYMVSQSRRYNRGLRALRGLVAEHVGELGILNSDFYIGAHFGGFRDAMPSPLLLDMAIHTFDAARYLSQADPVAVYCDEFNPAWSWYAGNASATIIFEMTNGLRYTYRGSWCSDGAHTSWEGAWRAVGARGSAVWDGHTPPEAAVVRATGGFHAETEKLAAPAAAPAAPEGIAGALIDFLHALDTGDTPMGECHDNIKSLAMVFGALESASKRQRVAVRF